MDILAKKFSEVIYKSSPTKVEGRFSDHFYSDDLTGEKIMFSKLDMAVVMLLIKFKEQHTIMF